RSRLIWTSRFLSSTSSPMRLTSSSSLRTSTRMLCEPDDFASVSATRCWSAMALPTSAGVARPFSNQVAQLGADRTAGLLGKNPGQGGWFEYVLADQYLA